MRSLSLAAFASVAAVLVAVPSAYAQEGTPAPATPETPAAPATPTPQEANPATPAPQEANPATPATPGAGQEATQGAGTTGGMASTPGQAGGSYTRAMMMSRNDATGANSIASIAMSDPQFSTLVRLVRASGLDNSLMYRGPLTVFAPTNDAFDRLPKGTVEALLMPENIKYLQAILMYHIVPGGYNASDVGALNGQMVRTTSRSNQLSIMAGPSIGYGGGGMMNAGMTSGGAGSASGSTGTTSGDAGATSGGGGTGTSGTGTTGGTGTTSGGGSASGSMSMGAGTARITRPDIMASNGVVHVVDTVLLPPMTEEMTRDLARSSRNMRRTRTWSDTPLLKEGEMTMKTAPTILQEKPLGGSATETPKAEQQNQPNQPGQPSQP